MGTEKIERKIAARARCMGLPDLSRSGTAGAANTDTCHKPSMTNINNVPQNLYIEQI